MRRGLFAKASGMSMKTNKVFDTKNFDKETYFSRLIESIRDKKITNRHQVYKILRLARLTDHSFSDWFFEKLDKNKVTWNDLGILIDLDVFPRTFVIRKLDYADKLETSPQSFQEKYAKVFKRICDLESRVRK